MQFWHLDVCLIFNFFQDLTSSDLLRELYLVCRIFRKGFNFYLSFCKIPSTHRETRSIQVTPTFLILNKVIWIKYSVYKT